LIAFLLFLFLVRLFLVHNAIDVTLGQIYRLYQPKKIIQERLIQRSNWKSLNLVVLNNSRRSIYL
jgi:hypothetical protein